MSNTFAVKEVLDFTVEKFSASGRGDIIFTVDYASQSNLSTTAERLAIRGGQGNYKILDLDHTKDCTFSATLPIVDVKALGVKLGKDITTGATTAVMNEFLKASASNTITLSQTPLTGTLKIYKVVNERDLGTEQLAGDPATTEDTFSILDNVITLNATTAPEGTTFFASYDYTSGANAQKATITASDFPEFLRITGRGLVDDDQEGQRIPVSFEIKKVKVQPNFELSMASDTATELDFTCDCYTVKSGNDRVYANIVKLEDEAV